MDTIQPTGEKNGTKRSILVESSGLPLAMIVSGANVHDVKLLAQTLDAIVVERPQVTDENPQHLCADAGYTGKDAEGEILTRAYTPHVRPRKTESEERKEGAVPRRWVVEAAHSWLNRFRRLLIRWEKKAENYLAFLHFACALVVWRRLVPVHA